jgi:hypothetical protein
MTIEWLLANYYGPRVINYVRPGAHLTVSRVTEEDEAPEAHRVRKKTSWRREEEEKGFPLSPIPVTSA